MLRHHAASCSECEDVTKRREVMFKTQWCHAQNVERSCSNIEMSWEIHAQLPRLLSVLTVQSDCVYHTSSLRIELCLWMYTLYPHACPAHRNMILKIQSEMSAQKKSILKAICTGIGFGYGIEIRYIPSIFCSNASCSGKSIWPDFRSHRFESWMDLITKWHVTSHHELDT